MSKSKAVKSPKMKVTPIVKVVDGKMIGSIFGDELSKALGLKPNKKVIKTFVATEEEKRAFRVMQGYADAICALRDTQHAMAHKTWDAIEKRLKKGAKNELEFNPKKERIEELG